MKAARAVVQDQPATQDPLAAALDAAREASRKWAGKAEEHCHLHRRLRRVQATTRAIGILAATAGASVLASRIPGATWVAFGLALAAGLAGAIGEVASRSEEAHQPNRRWLDARRLCDALDYEIPCATDGLGDYAGEGAAARAGRLRRVLKERVERARA